MKKLLFTDITQRMERNLESRLVIINANGKFGK